MAAEPMNGYGLLAVIVQAIASLAWPAAFVFAVWLFRRKLQELLPLFQVKHKEWEISFRLDQAEKEAAELPQTDAKAQQPPPTPEEQDRFNQLVDVSPRAAVLELRRELEDAVRNAAFRLNLFGADRASMLSLTRGLRNTGKIDKHTSALLDDLRSIGNAAAHSSTEQFIKSDALRYRDLANQVIEQLNALGGP